MIENQQIKYLIQSLFMNIIPNLNLDTNNNISITYILPLEVSATHKSWSKSGSDAQERGIVVAAINKAKNTRAFDASIICGIDY